MRAERHKIIMVEEGGSAKELMLSLH